MGTQGKKNTPITARVSTGLFNQKKGVTEPLLNVGQAGVHGNNQTRDIPSPSKMKGYAMKASPFKQNNKPKADEGDIKVITTEKGKNTTKTVTVPGKDTKVKKPYVGAANDACSAEYIAKNGKGACDKYKGLSKEKKDAANFDTVKGKDEKKNITVKGEDKKRERPIQTRDSEDTQTARERSNTVRGGKRMNKKERQAQKKIDRLNRKSGAIDPSTIKKDKDGNVTDKGKKYNRKDQKNARLMKEAEDNRKLASASSEGAQRQAEQNRSISARKTGTVRSNERDLRESDATTATQNTLVDKQLGVNQPDKTKSNPHENNSSTDGVTKAEKEGTDGALPKKTPDFFKKKTPLKMKYFK
mgnify:FL=1|tara:strand:+ start:1052 stop:2122 length:1071 start_codon:yes stop_codon:yes gene_type:complete